MFENLEVYQKALDLAQKVSEITEQFPKGNYFLLDQFNRAALSISLNIAEGNGRFHKNDRKQFFFVARGSVHECVAILELCRRKRLLDDKTSDNIKHNLETIAKMLSGLISGVDNRKI